MEAWNMRLCVYTLFIGSGVAEGDVNIALDVSMPTESLQTNQYFQYKTWKNTRKIIQSFFFFFFFTQSHEFSTQKPCLPACWDCVFSVSFTHTFLIESLLSQGLNDSFKFHASPLWCDPSSQIGGGITSEVWEVKQSEFLCLLSPHKSIFFCSQVCTDL